jgi:hypothetical protein
MFITSFNEMIKDKFILIIKLLFGGAIFGFFQDVDNSLLGKYVFKNRYNNTPNKKKYKCIYRLGLIFVWCLIYKYINTNNTSKCGSVFIIFYLITSVVSLYLQIMLEEHKEYKLFIEKVNNIKNQLTQNNIFNH